MAFQLSRKSSKIFFSASAKDAWRSGSSLSSTSRWCRMACSISAAFVFVRLRLCTSFWKSSSRIVIGHEFERLFGREHKVEALCEFLEERYVLKAQIFVVENVKECVVVLQVG